MGTWGIKSYEFDDAADALDAGFERVHGSVYEDLMDDANPTPFEQVQAKLASPATLAAALDALGEACEGRPLDDWDDDQRLAYAGIVVLHAELGVPIPADVRDRAVDCLEREAIEWDEATKRKLRRQKEIGILKAAPADPDTRES